MKIRLFIALPLTYGLKKKIAFLEKDLEKEIGFKINWIKLENLHLTLIFLGYISFEDFLKIEEIFKTFPWGKKSLMKEFHLKIKKVDFGPPGKDSMIWLYVEKEKRLEELKKEFEKKLEEFKVDYKREERDFLPHINLCRLKGKRIVKKIKKELNWGVIFNEVVLYESILKREGAEYEEKIKIKLISDSDVI
jgi:2'-5' RNA ligase